MEDQKTAPLPAGVSQDRRRSHKAPTPATFAVGVDAGQGPPRQVTAKMKTGNTSDAIYKEVVVIGNGPSGIMLSYMLSGNLPYVVSDSHPDEMLSARLRPIVGECLSPQDLEQLSAGLEGRSTNQISLLMDALLHPCADIGFEMEPLVEFRKTGVEIDHIVLGKGPPGGSWHRMDPHILTLSLGSWMALPGLPFHCRDSGEKRAYACNVAKYYVQYTEKMQLSKNFRNSVLVTSVEPINQDPNLCSDSTEGSRLMDSIEIISPEMEEKKTCFISNAINCLMLRGNRKKSRCKRPREKLYDNSPIRKIREIIKSENDPRLSRYDKKRSISLCCDSNNVCDSLYGRSFNENNINALRNSYSLDFTKRVPFSCNYTRCDSNAKWVVNAFDAETGEAVTYKCRYLVLANGGNDLPNRLEISKEKEDPDWLLYDLRSLETTLDSYMTDKRAEDVLPVLVVGAGLSAADAVIAVRALNIPVVHAFRHSSADLSKQLPENMYPEYHKVHQMMKDGGSTYPLYTAYPEHTLTDIDDNSHTIILTAKDGTSIKLNVSFAVVLIGSRPDLSFLPKNLSSGVKKNQAVDCKTNPININRLTHRVNGCENLFVVGPLAGDHFVRFIPGGALAVVSELYRMNK